MVRAWRWLAVTTVLVLLAGCGGPEGMDPQAWSKQFCGDLGSWADTVQASATRRSPAQDDPRQAFISFLDQIVRSTDDLLVKFDRLEKPAVENGEEAKREVRGGIERIRNSFADAKRKLEGATDLTAFQSALSSVTQDIRASGKAVDFQRVKQRSPDLHSALAKEPACNRFES